MMKDFDTIDGFLLGLTLGVMIATIIILYIKRDDSYNNFHDK